MMMVIDQSGICRILVSKTMFFEKSVESVTESYELKEESASAG